MPSPRVQTCSGVPDRTRAHRSASARRCSHARLATVRAGWLVLLLGGCLRYPLDAVMPADIETTLFLIGDAGEPDPRDVGAALDSLSAQARMSPENTLVVFLGDNVYPAGIPQQGQAEWADALRRLDAQIAAVPQGARGIFVPGNHDWADAGPYGLYSIRLQGQLIRERARGRDVAMLPANGCPGPATVERGRLRLILLDTHWWLHPYIVRDSASACVTQPGAVTAALRDSIRATADERVLIAAGHHPLMTGGEHGGYCGLTGPLHRFRGAAQDIMSSANRTMRDSLEAAFIERPPLAYVAGHEHNLQVLRGTRSTQYILVSGAGSDAKVSCAVRLRESYYVSQRRAGFMRLDILRDGGVLLRVYRYTSRGTGGLSYARWLQARARQDVEPSGRMRP
jgi:Calcineurin-like phosphoesterase